MDREDAWRSNWSFGDRGIWKPDSKMLRTSGSGWRITAGQWQLRRHRNVHLLKLGQTRVPHSKPHTGLTADWKSLCPDAQWRHGKCRATNISGCFRCNQNCVLNGYFYPQSSREQKMLPIVCEVNVNKMEQLMTYDSCMLVDILDMTGSKVKGLYFEAVHPESSCGDHKLKRCK